VNHQQKNYALYEKYHFVGLHVGLKMNL